MGAEWLLFDYLDGMFAFCILDRKKNHLFLAKDRAGKKPLYLYSDNDSVLFASEINAIKLAVKNLSINNVAIESYLRNGLFFCENTAFDNLVNLKAGHYTTIDINTLEINTYKYLLGIIFSIINTIFLIALGGLAIYISIKKRWYYNLIYMSEILRGIFGVVYYKKYEPVIKDIFKK